MRLRVVPANQEEPVQDCGTCKNSLNCWQAKIKEEHSVLSMLTCRIKRGIDVNRSTKLFLKMISPKLKTLAQLAVKDTNIPISVALADLESKTVEYMMHNYVLAGTAFPLHFLFGQPKGRIFLYANNYARSEKRFDEMHDLYKEPRDIEEEEGYNPADEEETTTEETRIAREVIEDGVTLSLAEYRVLSFCLQNATDAKRPVNGLHVYLARVLGVPRAKVTKSMSDASEKIRREVLNN